MDHAGASRYLDAVRRLVGRAALVALFALVALTLAAASAHAQVQAPPSTAPDATTSEPAAGDQDWDATDWDGDAPSGNDWGDPDVPDWPGPNGGTPPPLPGAAIPPPDTGDGDGWETAPEEEEVPAVTSTYVAGREARMRTDGKAAIPRGAPKRVRSLIAQYNRIVGKRYKWGGGHAKLVDTGYDCSGAVGYGLIKGGLLRTTMVSGSFARWGAAGAGRWVTIYAHKSHVYIEVAGLRLDTSSVGDRAGRRGVRWRPVIGKRGGFKVRHPVGL